MYMAELSAVPPAIRCILLKALPAMLTKGVVRACGKEL